MSDILSQEQIDALLSSENLGSGSGSEPEADKTAVLNRFFGSFCGQAGTVISTVLNINTLMVPEIGSTTDPSEIGGIIGSQAALLTVSLQEVEGQFGIVMKKSDVAVISDLMLMGDGTAEYNDDHKQAISELFNQVVNAFETASGKELGVKLTAGDVKVTDFKEDSLDEPLDSCEIIPVTVSVEGKIESRAALLFSGKFTDSISGMIPASLEESSDGQVGLNMSELDDLSKVTSFDSSGEFHETTLTGAPINAPRENIEMLFDIELDVSIELGRSVLPIKRILDLAPGSIVELDRMAGEPVDLLVNNKVVAKGEVVVIDESFGIRIVSLVSPEERIKSLR
ncbi:MAG: flagellar motor switch protein FliN [Fibrobacter sp.]|jgi:flagellar motor switch protein FliN/FliY|nr:flagellar motor switch protein FliN [Fibrobacter sp.]